jgi:hypothetical protein
MVSTKAMVDTMVEVPGDRGTAAAAMAIGKPGCVAVT